MNSDYPSLPPSHGYWPFTARSALVRCLNPLNGYICSLYLGRNLSSSTLFAHFFLCEFIATGMSWRVNGGLSYRVHVQVDGAGDKRA